MVSNSGQKILITVDTQILSASVDFIKWQEKNEILPEAWTEMG